MPPAVRLLSRVGCVFASLAPSVLAGSTLAVAVVEGRLSALGDLVWRIEWIVGGRRQAPGEADRTWMLEIEWKIALMSALMIALVGSVIWAIVSKHRLQSQNAAALIGFILSAGTAAVWLHHEPIAEATRQILLLGFIGAAMGVLTRVIDQALAKRTHLSIK